MMLLAAAWLQYKSIREPVVGASVIDVSFLKYGLCIAILLHRKEVMANHPLNIVLPSCRQQPSVRSAVEDAACTRAFILVEHFRHRAPAEDGALYSCGHACNVLQRGRFVELLDVFGLCSSPYHGHEYIGEPESFVSVPADHEVEHHVYRCLRNSAAASC